ncbi:uncharacterized protein LOC114235760 isoform X3 [Balaenoptera acutorostrata]|uniref:Uncharacterized protein LOC114235760 isoform X3 n=1 Tax=Balaenoptera acutorostrata TaxID=9767 RepID=A0ABM3TRC4_BALAC|nr:uncharacterized protein LOC114235760 isoform X3 [Balaenoptera acutorostrata]
MCKMSPPVLPAPGSRGRTLQATLKSPHISSQALFSESSGTPRYLCEYVSATSWATCSGAVSGTARSSTGPCTSMPSPCTAACPAGTPCVKNSDCTELDSGTASRELSDRGNRLPCPFSLFPHPGLHLCLGGFSIPSRVLFLASCWTDPLRVLTGDVPAQLTTAQGVSLSLEASGPLPALLGSGSCSRAFLPRTRGLPDLSRPGRRAGTPRLLLPPRWVLPGQASAQSSPDHGAEPCRMDGGLHLRPPTCGPAWQPCGSFPAMLTLSRSCVGSQWQAGPLGMGTPHHSGVGLAMP